MNRRGFSLVELMVVISVMSILLGIATMQFNEYSRKSSIENQAKVMLTDLMTVRSQAMFGKQQRAVKITATSFVVYPTEAVTGTPTFSRELKHAITSNNLTDPLVFDSRGLLTDTANRTICIEPSNNSGVSDSLIVSTTRIQIGKRNSTECDSAHITPQ